MLGLTHEIKNTLFTIEGSILIIAIILSFVLFSSLSSSYATASNLIILLELTAILGILSHAVLVVLIAGEIDISLTNQMEWAATITAIMSIAYKDTLLILVVSFIGTIIIGCINGFFVSRVGIPSFLVTLATGTALLGPTLILTKYSSIPLMDYTIVNIFYGIKILGFSISFYWFLGISIIIGIMLKYTVLGREMYAVGGDARSAFYTGINVRKVKFIIFVIASILAWFAGNIMACRSLSARAYMASGYLMQAIAAPILAGASLLGGTGSVVRTSIAAFLLNAVIMGVYILGLEPALYTMFMGVLLLVILAVRGIKLPPQLLKIFSRFRYRTYGKDRLRAETSEA
jgi:ribose/xylose/arabinose/galactoside ABC-type transport system permease subunit